jgi:hypothetical protein
MCSCGYANCDPAHGWLNTPYIRKLEKRKRAKVCIACGKKECACKRTRMAQTINVKGQKVKI